MAMYYQQYPDSAAGLYKVKRILGEGAFGKVFLVTQGPIQFAVKVGQKRDLENEFTIMSKKPAHPHIVFCHDYFTTASLSYIVMEFCDRGSLDDYIENHKPSLIPQSTVLRMTCEMADAVQYLHGKKIYHRDLKPDNVFLTGRENFIKIGDLAVGRNVDYTHQARGTFAGTKIYMSPEMVLQKAYTEKTDIWSLGCIIHEMMTLRATFTDVSQHQGVGEIQLPPMPAQYSWQLRFLVLTMCSRNPGSRPSASKIINHAEMVSGTRHISGNPSQTPISCNRVELAKAVRDFVHSGNPSQTPISCNRVELAKPVRDFVQQFGTWCLDSFFTQIQFHCEVGKAAVAVSIVPGQHDATTRHLWTTCQLQSSLRETDTSVIR